MSDFLFQKVSLTKQYNLSVAIVLFVFIVCYPLSEMTGFRIVTLISFAKTSAEDLFLSLMYFVTSLVIFALATKTITIEFFLNKKVKHLKTLFIEK